MTLTPFLHFWPDPISEHFAATINQLRGKVTMLFIAHGLPGNLQVDAAVKIGAVN